MLATLGRTRAGHAGADHLARLAGQPLAELDSAKRDAGSRPSSAPPAALRRDARPRRPAMLLPRRPRARSLGLELRAPFPKGYVLEEGDWSLLVRQGRQRSSDGGPSRPACVGCGILRRRFPATSERPKESSHGGFYSDIADDDLSSRTPEPARDNNDRVLLDAYSNAVIDVTERVGPAVVRVETGPKVRSMRERGGLGSGMVISPDGLVLTNSHVVGSSKEIRLRDTEGFVTDAHVLGVDPDTDLALLRADGARDLRYASLGNSKGCAAASRGAIGIRSAIHRDGRRGRRSAVDPLGERAHHRGLDQTDAAQPGIRRSAVASAAG